MKSFYRFFEQAEEATPSGPEKVSDSLVTTFGRNQPPHRMHGQVFDQAAGLAKRIGADERFYTSHSQDRKKNPLPYDTKIKHLKKMFPQHANKWDTDDNIKTLLQVPGKAHKDGYKDLRMVVGGDRQEAVSNLLRKYNGDLFDFDNIEVHNAGDRDEEAEGDMGVSASKLRRAAENDDFDTFAGGYQGLKGFGEEQIRDLYNDVQMFGMKNEEYSREDLRMMYSNGQLFNTGDLVESLTTCLRGRIHRCGANHLIVVTEDGVMFKSFIHDVQAVS